MNEEIMYSKEIAERIRKAFEAVAYPYAFDEETGDFTGTVDLQGPLIKVHILIQVLPRGFISRGMVALHPDPADPAQMARMAEFLTRVNSELDRGHFEMEYEHGFIGFRHDVDCYSHLPSRAEILRSFSICSSMFELYGMGIAGILFSDATPAELKALCEREDGPAGQLRGELEDQYGALDEHMDRLRDIMDDDEDDPTDPEDM